MSKENNSFDDKLKRAIQHDFNKEMDQLPKEIELRETMKISEEFNLKMNSLFLKENRNEKKKSFFKLIGIASILILALTQISNISNKQKANNESSWVLEYLEEAEATMNNIPKPESRDVLEWSIEYIPEGFIKKQMTIEEDFKVINYTNDLKDEFKLYYKKIDSNTSLNLKDKKVEEISILGEKGYLLKTEQNPKELMLIWESRGYLLALTGDLSKEKLVKVAKTTFPNY